MSTPSDKRSGQNSSDPLLWLGALVVAGVGLTWLLLSSPWSTSTPTVSSPRGVASAPSSTAASRESNPVAAQNVPAESDVDGWLRMARLASESGMLLEPESYSAWALYSRVLERQPDNVAAQEGLESVADALIERGRVALEQGRLEDAAVLSSTVLSRLPSHPAGEALDADVARTRAAAAEAAAARARPQSPPREQPAAPQTQETVVETAPARPSPAERIAELYQAFEQAMAGNRLLTPRDDSARHYVDEMTSIDPRSDTVSTARRRLFDELLARAEQAIQSLDTRAADTWIAQAEALQVDALAVEAARQAMLRHLIEVESARLLPASDLTLLAYVPPQYPNRAVTRGMEGWVDVEFTVALDGSTRDLTVADASHDDLFRQEALDAVSQWRFEPRVFMDQPIEQRAFTRIRFAFE